MSEKLVAALFSDLNDRQGFDTGYLDNAILNEWKDEWIEIIREHQDERMATLEAKLGKARECIGKYRRAIDAIYNHNEATRAAVVQHFGVLHPADAEILALRKTEASGE